PHGERAVRVSRAGRAAKDIGGLAVPAAERAPQGAGIGVAEPGGDRLHGEVGVAQGPFGAVAAGGVDLVAPGGARFGAAPLEGAGAEGEAGASGGGRAGLARHGRA
ncbi:hypothetical protein ACWF69_27990, partial [Nocardia sp. NPDC055049]